MIPPVLVISILLSISAWPASAQNIAVIQSQTLPIYQQALAGIESIYHGPLRKFNLEGNPERAENILRSLEQHPPNLILSIGLLATKMAKARIHGIPIVFCMIFDPERFGLAGENIAGVTLQVPLISFFSQIKRLIPTETRIGVVFDPKKTGPLIQQAESVVSSIGLTLISTPVKSEKSLPHAIRKLTKQIDLFWVVPDSTVLTPQSLDFLLLTSFEKNIPIITFSEDLVRRGALVGISADYEAVGKQAGQMIANILNGMVPGEISHQPAHQSRLTLNLNTARKMGISLEVDMLERAVRIYD